MNYDLNAKIERKGGTLASVGRLLALVASEKMQLVYALITIVVNSALTLLAPYLVGHAIDAYIKNGDLAGLLRSSALLLVVYVLTFVTQYRQMIMTGSIGQRVLFGLRNR